MEWNGNELSASMKAKLTDAADEEISRGKGPIDKTAPSFSAFAFWVREYVNNIEPLRKAWKPVNMILHNIRRDMVIRKRQQAGKRDKMQVERDSIAEAKLQLIPMLTAAIWQK